MNRLSGNNFQFPIFNFQLLLVFLVFLFPLSVSAQPKTADTKYPRVANYFLASLERDQYERLADYDLLILIPEAQYYYPDFFAFARKRNPDIIILPYVYSQSINLDGVNDAAGLKRAFSDFATEGRYLHTSSGKRILLWGDVLWAGNITTDWPDLMPQLIQEKIFSTGLWDGIFYDMVESKIDHYAKGDIDINNDGRRDSPETINSLWRDSMIRILKNTRALIGPDKYIVINGDSYEGYQPYVNGRMHESFPTPWEGKGRWEDTMQSYFRLMRQNVKPFAGIFNTTVDGRGGQTNYQLIRYSLASALLGDGYVSVDRSVYSHEQAWWYDEYNARLGRPTGEPKNVLDGANGDARPSVWRRDFQRGIALVNSTAEAQTVRFREEFEKLHGVQDPAVNDGAIVNAVTLQPTDGILLLRPLEEIFGGVFQNGSFVRVFTKEGRVGRTGFFAYDSRWRGGVSIVRKSQENVLVATQGTLELWNEAGARRIERFPYGKDYRGGLMVAMGDVDGDGQAEVVTAPVANTNVEVKVFSFPDLNFIRSFFPFGARAQGGATVAVADVTGDRVGEIIVGAGKKQEPRVRIFSADGKVKKQEWLAYPKQFRGGVNVAAGDMDGDGIAEVITGTGVGGGPHVRVFSAVGRVVHPGWFAYDKNSRGGVRVLAHDLDGDGRTEILTMTTDVFTVAASGN